MHLSRRPVPPSALLAAAIFLIGLPANAASIIARSVPELAQSSDAVVLARVEASTTGLDVAGQVQTKHRLAVQQWWQGEGPASIELAQVGGDWQGSTLAIDGDFRVEVGDTVVVFLRRGPDAWYSTLLGWSVFDVSGSGPDAAVRRNQQDFGLYGYDKARKLVPVGPGALACPATLGALHDAALAPKGGER